MPDLASSDGVEGFCGGSVGAEGTVDAGSCAAGADGWVDDDS